MKSLILLLDLNRFFLSFYFYNNHFDYLQLNENHELYTNKDEFLILIKIIVKTINILEDIRKKIFIMKCIYIGTV